MHGAIFFSENPLNNLFAERNEMVCALNLFLVISILQFEFNKLISKKLTRFLLAPQPLRPGPVVHSWVYETGPSSSPYRTQLAFLV